MSLILRGICAIACVSQSIRPAVQQQLPNHRVSSRQTSFSQSAPRSPCPEYFQYQADTWSGELRGVLAIPPPQDSTRVTVNLGFRINARLGQGSFTGSLDLTEHKDNVISRLRQGNRNPVTYKVVFPTQNPIPVLTSIVVNRQSICSSHPGTSNGYYTDVTLNHELISPYPIIFASNSYPGNNNGVDINQVSALAPVPQAPQQIISTTTWTTQRTTATPRPPPPPTQAPTTKAPVDTEKYSTCGVSPQVANLVVNGETVAKGAWPWLSAIYDITNTGLSFICGGSLVTKRHVITAAHCMVTTQGSATLKQPENVMVYLGKYNVINFAEQSTATEISDIAAHPEYTGELEYAGIDLAILTFKVPASFGPFIRPVCLWDSTKKYPQTGKVVGWGKDEYGNVISKTPKQVDMPIVTNEQCLRANPDYIQITSETTFCAGNRDDSGPCKGDSGGGLYVWDENSRRWAIRGVVSQSLWDPEKRSCDLKNYVTFTDISKLLDWIKQEIRQ
ncbi:serine protease gd-like isoform X1 [Cloeon dipterum]|uniref:serine protease gd-like isoform X1 n=1 Tax=Cloeon dipterum TaxID=197152 RepID=UPI00322020B2